MERARCFIVAVLGLAAFAGYGAELRVIKVSPSEGSSGINRAITEIKKDGGEIVLSAGTYLCSSPIILRYDRTTLRGMGSHTLLKLAAKANCPVVIIGDEANKPRYEVSGVCVADLAIDGNGARQGGECWNGKCDTGELTAIRSSGVVIRRARNIWVLRVSTMRCRSGGLVTEKHCRKLRVQEFSAQGHEFDGLACYETEDSTFTDLHLFRNHSAGISTDLKFAHNSFRKVRMEQNGTHGIFMRDSNHNIFEDIDIRGSGKAGIFIAQVDDRAESGCVGNRFTDVTVGGSNGPAVLVNAPSCKRNAFTNARFFDNKEGLREAAPGLVKIEGVSVQ
jgi:pectate lyase-like protein